MSEILALVIDLITRKEVRISSHDYDELAEDGILVRDVIAGITGSKVVEDYPDYPDYPKGPCVLLLQKDSQGRADPCSVGSS